MVRSKLNFKIYGQIINFGEGNFMLSNFGVGKRGLKRADRKISYILEIPAISRTELPK